MQSFDTIIHPHLPALTLARGTELIASAPGSQPDKADAENVLTEVELLELGSLEATVERGLRAFWEIGQALRQIRDKRLYRQDYATFENYCISRWEMSRRSAYQLIDAASVFENVRHGAQILPANERQTRPLVTLPPEQQREAWAKAVSTAPKGRVTSTHVTQVATEYQQQGKRKHKNAWENFQSTNVNSTVAAGETTLHSASTPTQSRSCWNCYNCSRELLKDDPQSFYCSQFGKLNFIEKDGNQRGAECQLWSEQQAESFKNTTLSNKSTFTLTLQLPAYLQPLIQDAAREEGLVVVDWAANVLAAAFSRSSSELTPVQENVKP